MRSKSTAVPAFVGASFILPTMALAATWTGGAGLWSDAAKWGGTVPNSPATDAFIDAGNPAASTVTVASSAGPGYQVRDLSVDADSTLIVRAENSFPAVLSIARNMTLNGTLQFGASSGAQIVEANGSADQVWGGTGTLIFDSFDSVVRNVGTGTLTIASTLAIQLPDGATFDGDIDLRANLTSSASSVRLVGVTNLAATSVSGGGFLSFSNATNAAGATLSVSGGATLLLTGNSANAGTINATGATVRAFNSTYTQAQLGTINRDAASTINLGGTLNGGLSLSAAKGSYQLSGTFNGGTLQTSGGASLIVREFSPGTLDGVTVAAGSTLQVSDGLGSAELNVDGGLTVNGSVRVGQGPSRGTVTVRGTGAQTLAGSGIISLSSAGGTSTSLASLITNSASGIALISDGLTIAGTGRLVGSFNVAGTLSPGDSIGRLFLDNGLTMTDGTLIAELGNATGTADLVSITGALSLTGPADALQLSGGVLGTTYVVMQWTGTRSGTFEQVTPGYNVVYDDALRRVIVSVAVPEPAMLGTLTGLAVIALRRRRPAIAC